MIEEDLTVEGASRRPVVANPETEDWPRLEESLRSLLFGAEVASGPPPLKPFQPPVTPAKDTKFKSKRGPKMKSRVEIDEMMETRTTYAPMTREKLRAALLEECGKEDFALLQVGSENFNEKLTHYRRPEFVSQYLKRNDIRPLKKVRSVSIRQNYS